MVTSSERTPSSVSMTLNLRVADPLASATGLKRRPARSVRESSKMPSVLRATGEPSASSMEPRVAGGSCVSAYLSGT